MGQVTNELICQNARKTRQNETIALWTLFSPKPGKKSIKVPQKKYFCPFLHFWPCKGHFGLLGPKKGSSSGQTATYRKTEVIQSYLRMWGSYDPIESGPSEPKKWGLYGRSVKKCRFSGQKWAPAATPRPAVRPSQHKKVAFFGWCLQKIDLGPSKPKIWGLYGRSLKKCRFSGQKWAPAAAPRPAVRPSQHKKVAFLVSRHDGIKKFGWCLRKIDFGPTNCIFGPKICFFLRYTHITPLLFSCIWKN